MQMLYLVEKAGDMPFVRSLAPVRLASSLSRVASSNTDTPAQRIARITSTLHLDLSQLLTAILTPPASSHAADPRQTREALTSLFRTYASLGLVSTAEDVVRRHVVRPFVLKTIHRDVLNSAQSPVIPSTPFSPATASSSGFGLAPALAIGERAIPSFYAVEPIGIAKEGDGGWVAGRAPGEGELDPLCELYNKLLAFVSRDCGMILDVTERTLAVAPATTLVIGGAADEKKKRAGYEILTNVVWDEIAARLMGELGHVIFAAGRPSIFQQVRIASSLPRHRLTSCAELPPHYRLHLTPRIPRSHPRSSHRPPLPPHLHELCEALPAPHLLPAALQGDCHERRADSGRWVGRRGGLLAERIGEHPKGAREVLERGCVPAGAGGSILAVDVAGESFLRHALLCLS